MQSIIFEVCAFNDLKNGIMLPQVHLIEGIIDQVEGTVHVSWVQPRVLGIPQIKSLRDRLDSWLGKVHTALLSIEAETPDLVASWFIFIFFPSVFSFLLLVTMSFEKTKWTWQGRQRGGRDSSLKLLGHSEPTLYANPLIVALSLFRESFFFLKGAAHVLSFNLVSLLW